MLAAAVVLLASASAVVAQVLPQQEPAALADQLLALVGLVPVVRAPLPHQPELPALAPPVLVHPVVEPDVPVHLRSRRSFSAAMVRSSPQPAKPTYARAPSTR